MYISVSGKWRHRGLIFSGEKTKFKKNPFNRSGTLYLNSPKPSLQLMNVHFPIIKRFIEKKIKQSISVKCLEIVDNMWIDVQPTGV